jgi:site-specific DNA-methyltransferase (adenine-specific)
MLVINNKYFTVLNQYCYYNILIVPTNGKEKTGYPTQKPLGILNRILTASSNPGDLVLDFFAGSGTVGEACLKLGRQFIMIDNNPAALDVMRTRFKDAGEIEWHQETGPIAS